MYKYCFECQNKKTIFVHNLFWTFLGGFNEQSLIILWVKRFKNESFWHRFTCTLISQMCFFGTINYETKCEFTLNLKQWATHHMLSLIHGLHNSNPKFQFFMNVSTTRTRLLIRLWYFHQRNLLKYGFFKKLFLYEWISDQLKISWPFFHQN